jgi:hypothetical protein
MKIKYKKNKKFKKKIEIIFLDYFIKIYSFNFFIII